MRHIVRELREVTSCVEAYERGRRAFVEGRSITDLGPGSLHLLRSGFDDAMADAVADICGALGIDMSRFCLPLPEAKVVERERPSYKPLEMLRERPEPELPEPFSGET